MFEVKSEVRKDRDCDTVTTPKKKKKTSYRKK